MRKTREEDDIYISILNEYSNGKSLSEMSKLYNIPYSTLYKKLVNEYNFKQIKENKNINKFRKYINFILDIGSNVKLNLEAEEILQYKDWKNVKEFYYFLCTDCKKQWKYTTLDRVKQYGCRCDMCFNNLISESNKIPFNEILKEVTEVNSEIKKYKDKKMKEEDWGRIVDKYWFKCNKCSEWIYKEYRQFVRDDKGMCTDCKGLCINWNLDKVQKYCKEVDSLFLSKTWNTVNDEYDFICTKCGKEISKTFTKFFSGQTVCKECAYKIVSSKTVKTHNEYLIELKEKEINIIPIDQYQSYNQNIRHKCPKCGREDWLVSPSNILSKKSNACMGCRESIGEEIINEYLLNNNLIFICEHKFKDLKSIKNKNYLLRYDFALFYDKEKTKIWMLIEYDGKHHFEPVNFGGISDERALENFKEIQINDQIKNEYALENNIPLLRIPYWELDNIEEILNKNII